MYIKPNRLKAGDHIRVIAPSQSMSIISDNCQKSACDILEKMGLKISFGNNCLSNKDFNSGTNEEKIQDLLDAFVDPNINGILAVIGGFNSNQLLDEIDYDLIAKNPKIFCGYSDITALQNAILTKSKLITYSGPFFSTFGCKYGMDWLIEHFLRATFSPKIGEIVCSTQWSDDKWYLDQEERKFLNNDGYWLIHEGEAQGTIIGGNLSTLCLLCGTSYFPDLKESILFLEDDFESHSGIFDRQLQQIIMQRNFNKVRAIVFGRFQKSSKIGFYQLKKMIASKPELKNIPIIANADFGHTMPLFTFPIGGHAKIVANLNKIQLIIN